MLGVQNSSSLIVLSEW